MAFRKHQIPANHGAGLSCILTLEELELVSGQCLVAYLDLHAVYK